MRISDTRRLLLVFVTAAAVTVAGCGADNDTAEPGAAAQTDSLTFEKQIEAQLNAVMDRLRYDDRSGLWENEFEYMREERTFDEYLAQRHVSYANADSLKFIEVKRIERIADTAKAEVVFQFEKSGRQAFVDQVLTLYYHNGRWIKPTISGPIEQAAFDSVRNAAIEAAEREAGR